jgi:hypothetical protein
MKIPGAPRVAHRVGRYVASAVLTCPLPAYLYSNPAQLKAVVEMV